MHKKTPENEDIFTIHSIKSSTKNCVLDLTLSLFQSNLFENFNKKLLSRRQG